MEICRSMLHIFEKPLEENTTVFEPLSTWSPKKSSDSIDNASFSEIFGEINFKKNHHGESISSPSSSSLYPASSASSSSLLSLSESNNYQLEGSNSRFIDNSEKNRTCYYPNNECRHKDNFSSMSSEGIYHCTEGLGFESSDDVEDHENYNISLDWRNRREEKQGANVVQEQSEYIYCNHRRSRINKASFPPPISCIGGNGKPFVNFKSYRKNGRFILKEVRIPQQEFLRASRENGRLKLELVSSDDEFFEEDEEDEIDDDDNFNIKNIKEVYEDIKEIDEDIKDKDIKKVDENTKEVYEDIREESIKKIDDEIKEDDINEVDENIKEADEDI